VGTDVDPGSALVTLCGAVREPGVCEIACETPLRDIVEIAGGPTEPIQAFLVGGYFGSWFPAEPALDLRLGHSRMREAGGSLGSGVIAALPATACGLRETARVMRYMAEESSGQCGPCVHGLRAISRAVSAMAGGRAARDTHARVLRWADDVVGRGACHHPDGAVRFLRSALSVFADEIALHERDGACSSPDAAPVLGPRVADGIA
jgi:NADH:ubiquinone oxidoreductase subunit F (NADH-binding)